MDEPSVGRQRLEGALRFIRGANRLLGYTRTTVNRFIEIAGTFPPGSVVTVLDVATGSADVPEALHRAAARCGVRVRSVGLDLHAATLDYASLITAGRVPLVRGDALQLPFENGAFDIVMSSMFLHHLPDGVAVEVLREINRVASRAVIIADLARSRRAYAWISLFTLASDPMVRHDARVSVRQAFRAAELEKLARAAGIGAAVEERFGHRLLLSHVKPG